MRFPLLSRNRKHLGTPCGVAVLVAYFIGSSFSKSIYDTLVDTNGNPMLPPLPDFLAFCTAGDVMQSFDEEYDQYDDKRGCQEESEAIGAKLAPPPMIAVEITARQAICVLEGIRENEEGEFKLADNRILPVVDDVYSRNLVGAVSVKDLRVALANIVKADKLQTGGYRRTSGSSNPLVGGRARSLLDEPLIFSVKTNLWGSGKQIARGSQGKLQRISANPTDRTVNMDPAPYQLIDTTELAKIHLVFRMLKLHMAYVTSNGRLVGVVDKKNLRDFIERNDK